MNQTNCAPVFVLVSSLLTYMWSEIKPTLKCVLRLVLANCAFQSVFLCCFIEFQVCFGAISTRGKLYRQSVLFLLLLTCRVRPYILCAFFFIQTLSVNYPVSSVSVRPPIVPI